MVKLLTSVSNIVVVMLTYILISNTNNLDRFTVHINSPHVIMKKYFKPVTPNVWNSNLNKSG